MKILIPIINFARAGGYRVLSELANAWTDLGHSVDFLVDHRSPPPYFPTRAGQVLFDRHGVVQARPGAAAFAPSGNGVSIYLGMWRALRGIGRSYDIILANHSLTAFPVALARSAAACKFYYVQAYEPEYYAMEAGWKAAVLRRLAAWSYRLPLVQVANAPIYVGHAGIRARDWIPPGLDAAVFRRRLRPPVLAPDRQVTLGVIGRREPAKGTLHALAAFEILAARNPRLRLKVAYGNLPDGWQHDRAEVVVPANDAELADYYRSIDIMLAPGTVQLGACHYPVLEAMACGTPVVTTGYLPANPGNAWIVPVADATATADAVTAMLHMPAAALLDKLDRAAAATARFHWPEVGAAFARLFEARLHRS